MALITIQIFLAGLILASDIDITLSQTTAGVVPTNYGGTQNDYYTGTYYPNTGPYNPNTGPYYPSTGPYNSNTTYSNAGSNDTYTANPTMAPGSLSTANYTGTANPPPTTYPPDNGGSGSGDGDPAPAGVSGNTTSPQAGDNCFSFQCDGTYTQCYTERALAGYCERKNQYCKVAVLERKDGNFTVTAECVNNNCVFSRISNDEGHWIYGCCNSNLCNDETLLDLGQSDAHLLSTPLLAALATCLVASFLVV